MAKGCFAPTLSGLAIPRFLEMLQFKRICATYEKRDPREHEVLIKDVFYVSPETCSRITKNIDTQTDLHFLRDLRFPKRTIHLNKRGSSILVCQVDIEQ